MISDTTRTSTRSRGLWVASAALAVLALIWPGAGFAEGGAEDFGPVDNTCYYTGFRGGPFPGVPSCVEGFTTDYPTCKNCTQNWDPDRDERIDCADDADCVRLVGKYMACGGPMTPFLVDDEDNVYFWAGRWNLHAIDRRGQLRWRFNLCNPLEDGLCAWDPQACQPTNTRMVPTVLDYHATLYFFIGNVLYAISSEGELLLKRRVTIPGVELEDGQSLYIANGPQNDGGGWANTTGAPVLGTDGTLLVSYVVMEPGVGSLKPSGVVRLSRTGQVLPDDHLLWSQRGEPALVGSSRLAGLSGRHTAHAGSKYVYPSQASDPAHGFFSELHDLEPDWSVELPLDFRTNSAAETDLIWPDMAVGADGRVYGLTRHSAVYGFDLARKTSTRLFNFHIASLFSWQNRPTMGPDGMMYLATHQPPLGPGSLWALDTAKLWQDPVPKRDDPSRMPAAEDYDAIKWQRYYGGGGWTTPVLSDSGRLYAGMAGLVAVDPTTGEQVWRFGERTMGSAPTILSDGTLVVGQGITGRVFFLKEDVPNGGMATAGWPTARHDKYLSNNAAHPVRWDRGGAAPYVPVETLLEQVPPCWNEADWDEAECGPIPEPQRPDPDAGAGDAGSSAEDAGDVEVPQGDAGDTGSPGETGQPDARGPAASDGGPGLARAGAVEGEDCSGCTGLPSGRAPLEGLLLAAWACVWLRRRQR